MRAKRPASLSVERVSEDPRSFAFEVVIRDGSGETHHRVSIARELLSRLAPGEEPASFVRRCFDFLLEREPKESILGRFDVEVIGRYFPGSSGRSGGGEPSRRPSRGRHRDSRGAPRGGGRGAR